MKVVGSDVEWQILCPGQENIHIGPAREEWAGVVLVLTKCSHQERGSFIQLSKVGAEEICDFSPEIHQE